MTIDGAHSVVDAAVLQEADWVWTPHLPSDYRGPLGRRYTPFIDPAQAYPIIAILQAVAARHSGNVAFDGDSGD